MATLPKMIHSVSTNPQSSKPLVVSDPEMKWRSRGYLPHVDKDKLLQSVTFHLSDSLPQNKLRQLERELEQTKRNLEKESNETDALKTIQIERIKTIEEFLDAGHGCCLLKEKNAAQIVQDSLLHFDGERYHLISWCVMPNHVHVIARPLAGYSLADIVHSWKSFTSNEINKRYNRKGAFWQREYFDRYIRDRKHLQSAIKYIENNPIKAGLVKCAKVWEFGSASYFGAPASSRHPFPKQ